VNKVEAKMSMEKVIAEIKQLENNGESLSKKKVKQSYPELLQSALFYFPSWEHAIQNSQNQFFNT
jgi:hypothetical protein